MCNKTRHSRVSKRFGHPRAGAALVEFAVCLPVIVLIIMGTIEATSAVFVRQSLAVSAYEGIREIVKRDGKIDIAKAKAESILNQRGVRSANIAFIPANPAAVVRGEEVTIEVSASIKANSPMFGKVLQDRIVTVKTTMVRE